MGIRDFEFFPKKKIIFQAKHKTDVLKRFDSYWSGMKKNISSSGHLKADDPNSK